MPASGEIPRPHVFDNRPPLTQRIFDCPRIQRAPAALNAILRQQQAKRIAPQPIAAVKPHFARQSHDFIRLRLTTRLKITNDHGNACRAAPGFRDGDRPILPCEDWLIIIRLIIQRQSQFYRLNLALFPLFCRRRRAEKQQKRQCHRQNPFHHSTISPGRYPCGSGSSSSKTMDSSSSVGMNAAYGIRGNSHP